MAAISLLDRFTKAMQPVNVNTPHNVIQGVNVTPGQLGIPINGRLSEEPTKVIQQLADNMPMNGMQPEQRAGFNMAAKMAQKAASDAASYVKSADTIAGSMADIHSLEVKHKGNMMKHSIKVAGANTQHLSNVSGYQDRMLSLTDVAREKHATIQMLAMAI